MCLNPIYLENFKTLFLVVNALNAKCLVPKNGQLDLQRTENN